MTFIQFIKSRYFFKNLLLSLLVLVIFIWIIFKLLDSYTLHGKTVSVPDFSDVTLADLDGFIKGKNVRYTIIDSIYDIKKPKGVVVDQDPGPGVLVKEDRKIYLYVTATVPPKVNMPKLKDRSLRQAAAMIEAYGLKLNPNIKYVPDQCANCVLKQLFKGKEVEAGTLIEKNSVISLVVGKGLGDEEVGVPNVIGLTLKEALLKLTESSLNEGAVHFDNPKDSLKSKVFRQIPGSSKENYVNMGSSIDLFLTSDISKIKITADTTGGTE
jgi:beta-lactam-binding protein with PASTA domain